MMSGRSSLPLSSHIGGVAASILRSGHEPGYTSAAKSSFDAARSMGSVAARSPASARVAPSDTSAPPAEKPMAPIFRVSADQSGARTHRADGALQVVERIAVDGVRGVWRAREAIVEHERRDAALVEEARDVVALVVGPQLAMTAARHHDHGHAGMLLR